MDRWSPRESESTRETFCALSVWTSPRFVRSSKPRSYTPGSRSSTCCPSRTGEVSELKTIDMTDTHVEVLSQLRFAVNAKGLRNLDMAAGLVIVGASLAACARRRPSDGTDTGDR